MKALLFILLLLTIFTKA